MKDKFRFDQLEFGTRFYDEISNGEYVKISEHEAQIDDERFEYCNKHHLTLVHMFDPDEIVRIL